jgi:para-aminobenzoate synthetase component 1
MVAPLRLPVIEELDTTLPPVALFELFRSDTFSFFLDGAMDSEKLGRYSFMGSSPFLRISARGTHNTVIHNGSTAVLVGDPFDVLGHYLQVYRLDPLESPVPFVGGAVGYLGYDLCHFIEKLPSRARDDLVLPDCTFGFYDLILAYDNLLGKAFIVSTGFPEINETARIRIAEERLSALKERLKCFNSGSRATKERMLRRAGDSELRSNFTREGYLRAVERARQYIIDGDIFEVNLSQRFETELTGHPYDLYLKLRKTNPAPFASYLQLQDMTVVSSSPERFLRCLGDSVETRPIKGTLPRGKTPAEDEANAAALLNSAKDHAENMMIVDLARNDLGRVCRFGTVRVTELAILETYPSVFHLTSTVVGLLREGVNRIDLIKATFPGGSITGAPKVRAMEIIDELEPTRRGVYTGSVGYFGFDGNLDLNIVIRTFLVKEKRVYFQAGGAVVYDSDPEAEYQETLDKARALVDALSTADS